MIELNIVLHVIPHKQFNTCIQIKSTNPRELNNFIALFNPNPREESIGKGILDQTYAILVEHDFIECLYDLYTREINLSEFDDKDITMRKRIENFLIQYVLELNQQFNSLAQKNDHLQNQIDALTKQNLQLNKELITQHATPLAPQVTHQPVPRRVAHSYQQLPPQIGTLPQNFFYPPGTEDDPNVIDPVWANSNYPSDNNGDEFIRNRIARLKK